jgi:hypothetical protein
MVYNTRNYWVFGLPIVWYSKKLENTTFRELCSLISLEYRMMDKVQKPSNSECYTLIHSFILLCQIFFLVSVMWATWWSGCKILYFSAEDLKFQFPFVSIPLPLTKSSLCEYGEYKAPIMVQNPC